MATIYEIGEVRVALNKERWIRRTIPPSNNAWDAAGTQGNAGDEQDSWIWVWRSDDDGASWSAVTTRLYAYPYYDKTDDTKAYLSLAISFNVPETSEVTARWEATKSGKYSIISPLENRDTHYYTRRVVTMPTTEWKAISRGTRGTRFELRQTNPRPVQFRAINGDVYRPDRPFTNADIMTGSIIQLLLEGTSRQAMTDTIERLANGLTPPPRNIEAIYIASNVAIAPTNRPGAELPPETPSPDPTDLENQDPNANDDTGRITQRISNVQGTITTIPNQFNIIAGWQLPRVETSAIQITLTDNLDNDSHINLEPNAGVLTHNLQIFRQAGNREVSLGVINWSDALIQNAQNTAIVEEPVGVFNLQYLLPYNNQGQARRTVGLDSNELPESLHRFELTSTISIIDNRINQSIALPAATQNFYVTREHEPDPEEILDPRGLIGIFMLIFGNRGRGRRRR